MHYVQAMRPKICYDWLTVVKGAPVRSRDWSTRRRIRAAATCRRCSALSTPVSPSCWSRRRRTDGRAPTGTCRVAATGGRRRRRSTARPRWDGRHGTAWDPSHWPPGTRSWPCRTGAGLHTRHQYTQSNVCKGSFTSGTLRCVAASCENDATCRTMPHSNAPHPVWTNLNPWVD